VSGADDRTVAMPVTPPADAHRHEGPDPGDAPPGAFDGPPTGADDGDAPAGLDGPSGASDGPPDPPISVDRWSRLAGDFVDEPEKAVGEANRLVREAVDAMLSRVRGAGGPDGDDAASTEDLRLAFRRYRDIHRVVSTL
jgi:hypothetical protein